MPVDLDRYLNHPCASTVLCSAAAAFCAGVVATNVYYRGSKRHATTSADLHAAAVRVVSNGDHSIPSTLSSPQMTPRETPRQTSEMGEECKMALVVRADLQMGPGLTAQQCSRACLAQFKKAHKRRDPGLRLWEETGRVIVVLQTSSEAALQELRTLCKAQGLSTLMVKHSGNALLPRDAQTVMAIGPAPSSTIDAAVAGLKLLA